MCVGAKICTSKAKTPEEAKLLCSIPKEPKPRPRSPQTCELEVKRLARCVVERIDMDLVSNINSIEVALINALLECKCEEASRAS